MLQLHNWNVEHDHGAIGDPSLHPYGNGVLVWFEVDDFDDAVETPAALGAEIVLPTTSKSSRRRAGRPGTPGDLGT